jgi:ABC-type spermidine/putrescine transport system permease subunit II
MPLYAVAVLGFLYLPIITVVVFSFDASRISGLPIDGPTLDWYKRALTNEHLLEGLRTSIGVALASALLSTVIGLFGGQTLARHKFRGKGLLVGLVIAPLIIPPIVLAISLLILYRLIGISLSPPAIVIAHTVFGISFATMIIYSRFLGFPESLLEAALDLGANEVRAYWEVVLPLVSPALIAAFLLCFTLSFDEFIVAWFVSGFSRTLPIEIWNSLRYGVVPDMNAIATLVFIVSISISLMGQLGLLRSDQERN